MENNYIEGGAFQIARKIFDSEIWLKKPATWVKIWIYILGKVNHTNNHGFERGENFFNFTDERRRIGNDITPDICKKFLKFLKTRTMISTSKSTRGVVIKVLNYNTYQDLNNYQSTTESTASGTIAAPQRHHRSTTINKNDKNDKNDKKESTDLCQLEVDQPSNPFSVFEKSTIEKWNNFCDEYPALSKIREFTPSRRKRLKERYGQDSFRNFDTILLTISKQPFLINGNPNSPIHSKWKISFDWLIKNDTNFIKVLEKKYEDIEVIE